MIFHNMAIWMGDTKGHVLGDMSEHVSIFFCATQRLRQIYSPIRRSTPRRCVGRRHAAEQRPTLYAHYLCHASAIRPAANGVFLHEIHDIYGLVSTDDYDAGV